MSLTKVTNSMLAGYWTQAVLWQDGLDAPLSSYTTNYLKTRTFQAGLTQNIVAIFKVPKSYTAGTQIFANSYFFSIGTTGNVLLQTTTTLVKSGQAYTSTTNQRTSTNSAASLGTTNTLIKITHDLTSSTGQINGVSVAADDVIIISLKRGTDTATDDVVFLESTTEIYI